MRDMLGTMVPKRLVSLPSRLGLTLVAAVFLAAAPAGAQAAETGPSAIVARLNATLIEVMQQAKELGYAGRYERLAPVLSEAFDFPRMTSIAAGRYWRKLDEAQQARLVEAFGRESIATFASRFDGYSGEHFEILGEEPGLRGSVLVRNRLVKADGEPVEINYLLRDGAQGWHVVDVYLEAKYSEMAIKRSEYTSVLANEGFDALLKKIDDKIGRLAKES
jgi:phospholipid transport system substrate-binding protein